MKLSSFIIQLAVCGQLGSAFSPLITSSRTVSFGRVQRSTSLFSSQWEDEEEDIAIKPTSFEEAGAGLQKEDDDKRMAEMGDFDANPSVSIFLFWCRFLFSYPHPHTLALWKPVVQFS